MHIEPHRGTLAVTPRGAGPTARHHAAVPRHNAAIPRRFARHFATACAIAAVLASSSACNKQPANDPAQGGPTGYGAQGASGQGQAGHSQQQMQPGGTDSPERQRLDHTCRAQQQVRACWLLGFDFEHGKNGPPDAGRAIWYWHRACQMGDQSACVALGKMTVEGRGTPRDLERAYQLFSTACAQDEPWGCAFAGRALRGGLGVRKDVAAGLAAQDKACTLGVQSSCDAVAEARSMRVLSGQPPTGAAGFRFGMPVEEARQRCEGAGHRWSVAKGGEDSFLCTGTPEPQTIPADVIVEHCGGTVCYIGVRHAIKGSQPSAWHQAFDVVLGDLRKQHGEPSKLDRIIPDGCEVNLAVCLGDSRARVVAVWGWQDTTTLALNLVHDGHNAGLVIGRRSPAGYRQWKARQR